MRFDDLARHVLHGAEERKHAEWQQQVHEAYDDGDLAEDEEAERALVMPVAARKELISPSSPRIVRKA